MLIKFLSRPGCHLLLVIVLGILGYSNTFNAPYIFDDVPNIVQNPIIKDLDYYVTPSKAKVFDKLQEYPLLINRYVGSLTFALNYKINGLDVAGYHIVNLLIHLINSLLVYWFIQLIFRSLKYDAGGEDIPYLKYGSIVALFASLLFVAHPIQTQAVTYIVQRFASLATMFYLISTTMYIKARLTFIEGNGKINGGTISKKFLVYYLLALLSAVLAMKTKEIAFTLPAMLVLIELLFFKEETKSRIICLTPFILTMLIIPLSLFYIADLDGGAGSVTRLATNMSRLDYLFTEFRVIITYLRLIFFPVGQNLDYDYPIYHSFFDPEVFSSFILLLTMCLTATYSFWRYRKSLPLIRLVFLGTAWFFVTMSIESSIVPIVDVIFEHRIYLPSIGIFLSISALLVMIVERSRQDMVEKAVYIAVFTIVLVLTGLTHSRNNVWSDKLLLWHDVVAKSPEKSRGYVQLGKAYLEKNNYNRAVEYYTKAVNLDPSNDLAYQGLGVCLGRLGREMEAINMFREALRANPHSDELHTLLGIAFGRTGQIDEAVKEFREALRMNPQNAETHIALGTAYYMLGRTNEAIKEFKEALRIDPDNNQARNSLKALGIR